MPRIIHPQMIEPCRVQVTMKDKEYSAEACGFTFKEGVAEKIIDMKTHGKDVHALQNVMMLFPGTSYKIIEKLDPEKLYAPTPAEPEETPEDKGTEETDEDEPETPPHTIADINGMKKAELQGLCDNLDVEYDGNDTVAELKAMLIESLDLE